MMEILWMTAAAALLATWHVPRAGHAAGDNLLCCIIVAGADTAVIALIWILAPCLDCLCNK